MAPIDERVGGGAHEALVDARADPAALARTSGATGFCYWHYWFAGRQLLQRPVDEVFASGRPDVPFCLAWANQSWSGIWHGAPDKVLIEQTYPGAEDDRVHFARLLASFVDPRYVTVAGRPVFFVYQPGQLPDPARFVEEWQAMAHDAGLGGLYLVASLGESDDRTPVADGFDAAVYFHYPFERTVSARVRERLIARGMARGPRRFPYSATLAEPPATLGGRIFPSVYRNWDNTPRSGRRGVVATGATPERFGAQVRQVVVRLRDCPADEQVLVIKSWNEWAEGNYLEPDHELGRQRLEALALALARALTASGHAVPRCEHAARAEAGAGDGGGLTWGHPRGTLSPPDRRARVLLPTRPARHPR